MVGANLLSCMNDKHKQQVCNDISASGAHLVYGNSFSGNFHEMIDSCMIVNLPMHEKISSILHWQPKEQVRLLNYVQTICNLANFVHSQFNKCFCYRNPYEYLTYLDYSTKL